MKSRKRIVALAAAAVLMSSVPNAVFAESVNRSSVVQAAVVEGGAGAVEAKSEEPVNVAITKEKAEELARSSVSIPKEYTLQSTSFSTDVLASGKRSVWGLDFVKKVNGKHKGSIYVRLNADNGQLIEFNSYVDNPSAKPTYPLKVEREEAVQLAGSFINKIAPDYAGQLQYNPDYGIQLLPPLTGEVRHSIRYDRLVNGIPYVDNYIELDVDSEGHILRYTLQWDDTIVFPDVQTKLTPAQANTKLKELAKPILTYIIPNNTGGQTERKPLLGYEMGTLAIDAISGQLVKEAYSRPSISASPVSDKALGDKPAAGSLTEQQAVDKVKASFKLPGDAELAGTSFNEYTDEFTGKKQAYWYINWSIKSGNKENGSASATVDSHTGVIRSFNFYYYDRDNTTKPSVSYEQAKSKAVAAVKQHLPWAADELYLIEAEPGQYDANKLGSLDAYYITFAHKIHGAVVDQDYVSVSIDARTGDIRSYDANIADFVYPDKAPATIGSSQAIENWLTYYRTELTYYLAQQVTYQGQPIPIEKYNLMLASGEIKVGDVEYKSQAQLVYRLVPRIIDESVFLDAETGNWRNRSTGEVTQLEKPKATDIDGHWAQRQLELMVAYKALDVKDGKVRPNAIVTRGELIKMLVLAMNSGRSPIAYGSGDTASGQATFNDVAKSSSYYIYIESAVQQNLIDVGDGTFNPEGEVDREEMAELIVRALGYNSLAEYEDLFNVTFKDAAKTEKKGQAAIVVGLKIMSLSNNEFQPDKKVSRAEASTAFFRFLQTRADLQEAPLRN